MIKMFRKAKFLENKKKLFKTKGYRIKVDKNSYILFKKEEDYLTLFFLEKVYFDFCNNFFSKQDEVIRLFFRITLIEKYIKSLSEIEIVLLYDSKKTENPLNVKFPNVPFHHTIDISEIDYFYIIEEMGDLGNEDLEKKYINSLYLMENLLSVKYLEKNVKHNYTNEVLERFEYEPVNEKYYVDDPFVPGYVLKSHSDSDSDFIIQDLNILYPHIIK